MKVWFGQIYIEVGASFSFSHHFQLRLSREISALVVASPKFVKKYGDDYELMFRISAKKGILNNEIKGPAVYRKAKDIEYAIFLPYSVISNEQNRLRSALVYLLDGVCTVFAMLDIDTANILNKREAMIKDILADPLTTQSS